MTQEQIAQLKEETVKVQRQIDILNGEAFADTVPEIDAAKEALQDYLDTAKARIAEAEAETAPAPAATVPGIGQVNLSAVTAAIQANPGLKSLLTALLQGVAPVQA